MSRSSRSTAEVPLDSLIAYASRSATPPPPKSEHLRGRGSQQLKEYWQAPPRAKARRGVYTTPTPYAGPAERVVADLAGAPHFTVRYNPNRCAPFGLFEVYRHRDGQLLGAQLSYPDAADCRRVAAAAPKT